MDWNSVRIGETKSGTKSIRSEICVIYVPEIGTRKMELTSGTGFLCVHVSCTSDNPDSQFRRLL